MRTKKPTLPLSWYSTVAATAFDLGVHPDQIYGYFDVGLGYPGALVPKASLPIDVPGPAPHVCVLLPDYQCMAWQSMGEDRAAPLIGTFRAFQVDGQETANLTLTDCAHVYVARSDLVVTLAQREEWLALGGSDRGLNPTERRTLIRLLGAALALGMSEHLKKPSRVSRILSDELSVAGDALSITAITPKVKEAIATLSEAYLHENAEDIASPLRAA